MTILTENGSILVKIKDADIKTSKQHAIKLGPLSEQFYRLIGSLLA